MNKKEFYSELMKAYTVDTEKIKCNAKRRALKKNTSSPLKWVSGIAACTAAAAAIVALSVSMIPKPGIDIVDNDLNSAIERVYAAEQRFKELAAKNEVMDMYLSFEEEHSLNEILMAFSSIDNNGDIKLSLLYTSEGKYYKYSNPVSEDIKFRGAKVTVPAKLYEELNRLKIVSLAEPVEGSSYTDKSFVPYIKKEQNISVVTTWGETVQVTVPEFIVTDSTTVSEDPQPAETTDISQSETTSNDTGNSIEIPVSDIKTAQFISNDKLIVTTSDSIRLYKLLEGELKLEITFYANDAKISYSDSTGAKLYITACDTKGRNRLFYADGAAGELLEIGISSAIAEGSEIASVMCSSNGSGIVLKTVSAEKAYLYYAVRNGNSITAVYSKEYTNPVSVISCCNEIIYTAVVESANAAAKIYALNLTDGSERELANYSAEGIHFVRSSEEIAAIVIEDEGEHSVYLLTPAGTLIEIPDSPTFSKTASNVFKAGEKYFMLENDTLISLNESDALQYFAEAGYPYDYRVNIFEDGTAEIVSR